MFWIAAAWAASSEPPLSVDRRSMLPQRSNRCMPTNSRRNLLVTGELNSTCSWRSRGKRRSLPASGARVALIYIGQLHHASTFCSAAILTLGDACQVMRRLFCCTFPRFSAGLLLSGMYVHASGLYAFLFVKTPAYAFA